MAIDGNSELALGILAGREFTQDDAIRIVTDLYPYHKRYTFKEEKHNTVWSLLCYNLSGMVVVLPLGGVEMSPDDVLPPSSSSWGTARTETHALMCGKTTTNQHWLTIHATTQAGLEEARDVIIRYGHLPTEVQAMAKQAQVRMERFEVIAVNGIRIGLNVKSMSRCDTWTGTVIDITEAGLVMLRLTNGQTKTVKPTSIQAQ
jgi:hypothetical protein